LDGSIDRLEVFRSSIEEYKRQINADFLFNSSFQEAYLERDFGFLIVFLDKLTSSTQIKKMHAHYIEYYLAHVSVA
jgi:hypothetical protein